MKETILIIGGKKHILRKCPDCGEEKFIALSDTKRRNYKGLCVRCNGKRKTGSNNPMWKGGKIWINIVCPECKKERLINEYYTKKSTFTGLCHRCNCLTQSGEGHAQWKGGRWIDNHGYIRLMSKGHPFGDKDGYVLEHRLVAANEWGIEAVKGMHVHHKDGDRKNNKIENLELLSISMHISLHKRKPNSIRRKYGSPNSNIICACGCGHTRLKYDKQGNPRKFIWGHSGRGLGKLNLQC